MLWFALYGVSLLAALVFGRIYCGYICPMNTLMIPTEKISKKLGIQKEEAPKWLRSGKFAWVALIGSVLVMLLSKRMFKINLPVLLIWLVASVIITLRYKPFVFHNYICPFGVLQKLFGKFAIFSERVDKDGCIGCGLCEKVCPSQAVVVKKVDNKAEIDTALCLQCTNCQQVCPKNTIQYTK